MSDEQPMNEASTRTETGAIKDQTSVSSTSTGTSTPEKSPSSGSQAQPKPSELNVPRAPARSGAPEAYQEFRAPEGFELNPDRMKDVHSTFKEMGLSQAEGQKLMDLYLKEVADSESAPYRVWQEQQEKWRTEIRNDPDIGGKLDQVRETVARAIDGLGDPKLAREFREAMDYTGAGNNPAFIRTFYRLASMVTEGKAVPAGGPSPAARPGGARPSLAQSMYPSLPSQGA